MPVQMQGGKTYYQVAERLHKFAEMFPKHRILSRLVHKDERSVVMEVTIVDENGQEQSRGHAEGMYGRGDKVIEKTESVACGRALAFLSPELMGSEISSADEIAAWMQHGADKQKTWFKSKQMKAKYYDGLKAAAAEDDALKARELWDEMDSDQQLEIWDDLRPSSRVRSTIKKLLEETQESTDAV